MTDPTADAVKAKSLIPQLVTQSERYSFASDQTAIVTIPVAHTNMLCVVFAFNSVDLSVNVACLPKRTEYDSLRPTLSGERNDDIF